MKIFCCVYRIFSNFYINCRRHSRHDSITSCQCTIDGRSGQSEWSVSFASFLRAYYIALCLQSVAQIQVRAVTSPRKPGKSLHLKQSSLYWKKIEEGMRVKDIASWFDMAATTVVIIRKVGDKIIASGKYATPLSAKIVTKHRPAV